MPETPPEQVQVSTVLRAMAEELGRANLACNGMMFTDCELYTQGQVIVTRLSGGLLGLLTQRQQVTAREDGWRITGHLDPDLYERLLQANATALGGDLSPVDVDEAKVYILDLIPPEARGRPIPTVQTPWGPDWVYWMGQILRAAGHEVLGSSSLTQRTLGWLEALWAAKERSG